MLCLVQNFLKITEFFNVVADRKRNEKIMCQRNKVMNLARILGGKWGKVF